VLLDNEFVLIDGQRKLDRGIDWALSPRFVGGSDSRIMVAV